MKCSVLRERHVGAVLCAGLERFRIESAGSFADSGLKRLRQKLQILSGIVLLTAIALSTLGCPAVDEIVIFDDPNLDRAVRDELGQPFGFLTRQGLLDLRTLDAKGLGITDLTGIEYCENLTWLDLDTNGISDITPLANLTNLMSLNLDSNEVFDIAPLAGLLNLDSLSLFDNQVGDIQALVTNAVNGGLGPGDFVILDANTLSVTATDVDVPLLESMGLNVVLVVAAGA